MSRPVPRSSLPPGAPAQLREAVTASLVRYRAALPEAIDADQLRLHDHPIIDLAQRRVRALEALARWQHPEFARVPAAEFIALAEESGDIPRLGQWVLRRADHPGGGPANGGPTLSPELQEIAAISKR